MLIYNMGFTMAMLPVYLVQSFEGIEQWEIGNTFNIWRGLFTARSQLLERQLSELCTQFIRTLSGLVWKIYSHEPVLKRCGIINTVTIGSREWGGVILPIFTGAWQWWIVNKDYLQSIKIQVFYYQVYAGRILMEYPGYNHLNSPGNTSPATVIAIATCLFIIMSQITVDWYFIRLLGLVL